MGRTTSDLAISNIEIPTNRDRHVDHNKHETQELSTSLQLDGLLQPILVQPPEEDGGKYRLVFGVRRFKTAKHLGWKTIRAEIDDAIGEKEAEAARLAENMYRSGPKRGGTEWLKHLAAWRLLHEARQNGKSDGQVQREKASSGQQRDERGRLGAAASEASPRTAKWQAADNEGDGSAQSVEEPPFHKQVMELTGCSERTSYRDCNAARAFSPRQIERMAEACEERGDELRPADLAKIAALNDPDMITWAVVQVCDEGRSAEEAIEDVKKVWAEDEERRKQLNPSEYPDDMWLDQCCYEIRPKLGNTAAFDQAALAYRKLVNGLRIFKNQNIKVIKEAIRSKRYDPFTALIAKVMTIKHPNEWAICAACDSTGLDEQSRDGYCEFCHGTGFTIAFETQKGK